ncbi:MAG TPA: hypothetical protein VN795_05130 [Stellaceae bacterium]|nr:hypothetical protein [Stellaceae bacterium]
MLISIRNPWREYLGVAAISAGAFVLWLLLAPTFDALVAVEGLILAAAAAAWSRLADL